MADSAPLNDVARQRLAELIEQYGRPLAADPVRCETLLRDLCGDYRREAFILVSALKGQVVAELLAAAEGGKATPVLLTLSKRMHEQLTLPEEACRWAVETWAQALTSGIARKQAAKPAATATLPPPNPEQRRIAVAQFSRANQAVASGNHDYAIQLLMTCCKLDPASLIYRQALRRTEKVKFNNNLKGGAMATLANSPAKAKIMAARRSRKFLEVLEYGEEILARNPWDSAAQIDMADAADNLGLLDMAIWILEQARQKDPNDASVNRPLAQFYEKRGNFTQAIGLWDLVQKAVPTDKEAGQRAKDLAANHTIQRGNYEEVAAPSAKKEGVASALHAPTDRIGREVAPILTRLKTHPTNPDLYVQLANIYRRAGQLDQAQAALEQGLGPSGNHFQLTFALAELALEPFRRDLAVAEEQLRGKPDDEELRKVRLRLLKEINARELELYRQKADRFPTEGGHRLELGVRLLRAGQVDEAIRELQLARSDPRSTWRALMYLGHCFKARNNWKLAQRNFEEALKILPTLEDGMRKEILFQLANGHADAGDLATALELGHELANLDFSYKDIGRLLDEWQTKLQEA
jgi:tetratricopeptide (TPR) repeat protein